MGFSKFALASMALLPVVIIAQSAPSFLGSRRLDSCEGVFVPTESDTIAAFEEAGGKAANLPKFATLKKYVKAACIYDEKEFAMFMANLMQESDRLKTAKEYSSHFTDASYDWGEDKDADTTCTPLPCKEDATCADKCKVHYYGRGYLQTTWRKNYVDAKDNGGCDKDDNDNTVNIVEDPDQVATQKSLAWCTAAYYWKTAVHLDRCKKGGEDCDMGNTIHAINAKQECGANAEHKDAARTRYCFYAKFYKKYSGETPWADSACISDLGTRYATVGDDKEC
jgi:predicted chitinase